MIVGIRIRGESIVKWIEVDDDTLKPGDQVTVDGVEASVVVGSEQVRGSLNPEHLTNATVK